MIHNIDKVNLVDIFDISFSNMSYAEVIQNIHEMIVSEGAHQVVLANAHTLNLASSNLEYHKGCGSFGTTAK